MKRSITNLLLALFASALLLSGCATTKKPEQINDDSEDIGNDYPDDVDEQLEDEYPDLENEDGDDGEIQLW